MPGEEKAGCSFVDRQRSVGDMPAKYVEISDAHTILTTNSPAQIAIEADSRGVFTHDLGRGGDGAGAVVRAGGGWMMLDTSAVTPEGRARQRAEVWACISDQQWWTLYAIAERTGNPAQSVSARLRDFRKKRYGERTIERRYVAQGLFEYRWVP